MAGKAKAAEVVGDLCLYGAPSFGYGWLLQMSDGKVFGDEQPKVTRGATECLFAACLAVRDGNAGKFLRVFAPGGQRMALMNLSRVVWFGDLKWQPAPVYVLSVEELVAASEGGAR